MAKFELIKKFQGENDLLPKRKTVESAGYDFIVAEDTIILPYHYHFSNMSQGVFEKLIVKKLDEKYTCHEIISGLKAMDLNEVKGEGYIPTYTRTDFTDDLHEVFGFNTDHQITRTSDMKKIFKATKK